MLGTRKPIIFGPNSDFVFHIDEKQLEILNINFYENANANHQKGVRGQRYVNDFEVETFVFTCIDKHFNYPLSQAHFSSAKVWLWIRRIEEISLVLPLATVNKNHKKSPNF